MSTLTGELQKRWEIHNPLLFAVPVFALAMWQGPAAFAYADGHKWHIDQLYTCVFTYSTVITAFLFTFYTFIITGDRGFLAAARSSIYFKHTISYTFRAIIVGAILSFVTIPMLIVQPVPAAGDVWVVIAALWAALTVWATASFVRAAWLFAIFAGK